MSCTIGITNPNTETNKPNQNNEGSFQINILIVDAFIAEKISQLNLLSQQSFHMKNNHDE